MKPRKLFYIDTRNEVIVTDSSLTVKKKRYLVQRIKYHGIKILRPILLPGLTFATAGTFLIITGLLKKVVFHFIPFVTVAGFTIDGVMWVILTGLIMFLAGIHMMSSRLRPKYALHISTEDEENDVIISDKREYVRQIRDALNKALNLQHLKSSLADG